MHNGRAPSSDIETTDSDDDQDTTQKSIKSYKGPRPLAQENNNLSLKNAKLETKKKYKISEWGWGGDQDIKS